jgi:hypothetical protein
MGTLSSKEVLSIVTSIEATSLRIGCSTDTTAASLAEQQVAAATMNTWPQPFEVTTPSRFTDAMVESKLTHGKIASEIFFLKGFNAVAFSGRRPAEVTADLSVLVNQPLTENENRPLLT